MTTSRPYHTPEFAKTLRELTRLQGIHDDEHKVYDLNGHTHTRWCAHIAHRYGLIVHNNPDARLTLPDWVKECL